ncbi:MAG: HAD family hydrolase [Desulfobacula sp.]|jgi:phosphoglycolate phosphatase-like HAD superfamily hydrolase
MKKQKLSAVVFDCDGVLIESNAVKTMAFGQTVEEFGPEAMDRLMNYHREHGGISRFKKFEWFYSEVVKAPLSDEMMDILCDRFTQFCIDAVLDAPMVAGARESLDFLSGKLPLFVASGTPEKELQDILIQRGLAPYFKRIHGTPPEKQYLLERIIRENGLDASKVLMVGDAVADLKAAQYCNTLFYGRGERFRDGNAPWGQDLTGLIDYLSRGFGIT